MTRRARSTQIVQGDVTDPAACLPAVMDADAVVVTLGAGRQGRGAEAGTRAVVAAMKQAGVGRLVCQSTLGVGSSRRQPQPAGGSYVMFGRCCDGRTPTTFSRRRWWRSSDLRLDDRAAVRLRRPSPGPVRHGFGGSESGLRLKIGRADVAAFLLAQVEDQTYLRRAVSVSS